MVGKGKDYVIEKDWGMPDMQEKPDTQRESVARHESWQIYHFKPYLMDKVAKKNRSYYCHAKRI